jgi:hypothetical protein
LFFWGHGIYHPQLYFPMQNKWWRPGDLRVVFQHPLCLGEHSCCQLALANVSLELLCSVVSRCSGLHNQGRKCWKVVVSIICLSNGLPKS